MPELPEVETIVRGLKRKVLNRTFLDVWTDWRKMIKEPEEFESFKNKLLGKKILDVKRRGKLILFELSGDKTLLAHQKMTGHFLVGKWKFETGKWIISSGPLSEKTNTYLHLIFTLDNGEMIGFSDLRKFGWVRLLDTKKLHNIKEITNLGPEPLDRGFTFSLFEEAIKKAKGAIKNVLMNQKNIAGIGNIYSDEILWRAKVHPLRRADGLGKKELKDIYNNIKDVLEKAIKLQGESISDFRTVEGKRGDFDKIRKVYQREKENCSRCKDIIKRIKVGGRSAHYCPRCQKV